MNFFLKFRDWQLFLLTFGLPVMLQIVFMVGMVLIRELQILFLGLPLIMLAYVSTFFGWVYSLGMNLQKKLPDTVKMNSTAFKILMVVVMFYMMLIGFLMVRLFKGFSSAIQPDPVTMAGLMAIIFPLHLFVLFCIFYTFWFVAKSLKSVELQRPAGFGDFAGEFFLIWFYPVGLWFIQPRINRIFDDNFHFENQHVP